MPPAPEKNMIGTTKIKIGFHPVLRVDPDFRDFLEIDTDLPKATSTSAFSGAGVVRLFNRVGETVNKISYRMDEADPVSRIYLFVTNYILKFYWKT